MNCVRPATAADLPAVERIFQQVMCTAEWIPRPRRGPVDFASATQAEQIFVYCRADHVLAGFISIWQPESFIHHLYVDDDYRGQGVGTALLDSLDPWLPKPWRLKCNEANQAAAAFYRARGWHLVSGGDGEWGPYYLLEFRANDRQGVPGIAS